MLLAHNLPSFGGFSCCCHVHLLTEGLEVEDSSSPAISWPRVAIQPVFSLASQSQLRKTGLYKASLGV